MLFTCVCNPIRLAVDDIMEVGATDGDRRLQASTPPPPHAHPTIQACTSHYRSKYVASVNLPLLIDS